MRAAAALAACCALLGAAAQSAYDEPTALQQAALERLVGDHEAAREVVKAQWHILEGRPLPCARAAPLGSLGAKGVPSAGLEPALAAADFQAFHAGNIPIYSRRCLAFVSHKHRFIYVRILGAADAAVLRHLQTHACTGLGAGPARCGREELALLQNEAYAVGQEETDRWWREYFVFSFVRNPWARLSDTYEAFTQGGRMRRRLPDGAAGAECGAELAFVDVAKRAGAIGSLCTSAQCCARSDAGSWKPSAPLLHVHDQSHCLFDAYGRTLADFIGTAETFDEDFAAAVAEINRRAGADTPLPTPAPSRSTQGADGGEKQCSLDTYPLLASSEVQREIALQYALDAVRLGYLSGYLPQQLAA